MTPAVTLAAPLVAAAGLAALFVLTVLGTIKFAINSMLNRLSTAVKRVARILAIFTLWAIVNSAAQANNSNEADSEAERIKLRPKIELNEPSVRMTLLNAVETANKKYPSIARANQETHKLKGEISVARTQYLPRMDMLFQELRASQNVTAGTILPQYLNVIPIQSGAPATNSSFNSIFGSNAGLNFSWELVDFGRRAANVKLAKQSLTKSTAELRLTELDVTTRSALLYLKLLLIQQQILVCQATLDRMSDWSLVVHTLCDKGLKPGVDAARADAEVSLAKIALIQAKRDADLAQQDLAEAIGMAGALIQPVAEPLISRPKFTALTMPDAPANLAKHPLAVLKMADVDVAKSRLNLLDHSWYPHLWLESAIWGRGSGDGRFIKPIASGIIPKTANWTVGFTFQFPVMEYFKIKAQKITERSSIEAQRSNYDLAMQELIREDKKAKILLSRAEEIADETPVLLVAAKENEIKARERYRVGLTNVMEVAEAERILAKAQAENVEAQIKVWQSVLAIAYAHGDIQPFLKLVAAAETNKGQSEGSKGLRDSNSGQRESNRNLNGENRSQNDGALRPTPEVKP